MTENTVKIFVGRLPEGCTTMDIEDLFSRYGTVSECVVIGKYGFVHMNKLEEANEAIKKLNKYNFMGSPLSVEISKSKSGNDTGKIKKTFPQKRYDRTAPFRGSPRNMYGRMPLPQPSGPRLRPPRPDFAYDPYRYDPYVHNHDPNYHERPRPPLPYDRRPEPFEDPYPRIPPPLPPPEPYIRPPPMVDPYEIGDRYPPPYPPPARGPPPVRRFVRPPIRNDYYGPPNNGFGNFNTRHAYPIRAGGPLRPPMPPPAARRPF